MIYVILIGLLIAIPIVYLHSKRLKLPNVYLITGGVKTGKSFVSVNLAIKQYRKNLFIAKVKRFFEQIFKKEIKTELPMLYSNIHLRNIKYNLFSADILERQTRIPYKSVVLIDEASLLADSMLYKNDDINEKLMLFVKLFGHYSKGGTLIINTQALHDMHFSFKRGISTYLWIHSKVKFPFITMLKVREMMFSDDTDKSINSINDDVEDGLKTLWVLNKYYKYYDCFCYSIFTDYHPVEVDYERPKNTNKDSLKTDVIISLREFKTLKTTRKEVSTDDREEDEKVA